MRCSLTLFVQRYSGKGHHIALQAFLTFGENGSQTTLSVSQEELIFERDVHLLILGVLLRDEALRGGRHLGRVAGGRSAEAMPA